MSTINFSEIDCKQSINKENKIINFNGSEIRVVNYLSTYNIYDLVMITLQKSLEDGIYNPVRLETYFNLHLVYLYTNIVFSMEDRKDEVDLYDTLKRSGLISLVREAIGEEELLRLEELLNKTMRELNSYNASSAGTIITILDNFGEKLKGWLDILQNFSPELSNTIKDQIQKIQPANE
jgi:hypothetical protein